MKSIALLLSLLTVFTLVADEPQPEPTLEQIEAELKDKPDDGILHYKKCRALFALGKEQEAIDHAAVAMEKFKQAGEPLRWMSLGFIETEDYFVEVHFNMGERERAEKRDGIVRPYSFRIWKAQEKPELVRIIDFELGYDEGVVRTAAVGEMRNGAHLNFGIVKPDSKFPAIKAKVLDLIKEE